MNAPVASPATKRLQWVDAAKGLCILLVVLRHVTEHVLDPAVTYAPAAAVIDLWQGLYGLLTPLRLPLFFLLSGYLVRTGVLNKPAPAFWRGQVAFFLWLWLLWTALQWSGMTLLIGLDPATAPTLTPRPAPTLASAFGAVPRGDLFFLWYIFALPVYATLSRLCRAHHVWLLAPAAVLGAAAYQDWLGAPSLVAALFSNWLFYVAGFSLHRQVDRLHAGATPGRALAAAAVFGAIAAWGMHSRSFYQAWVFIPMAAAAIVMAIQSITLLGASPATTLLAFFGRRTLPIYVIHPILLVALSLVLTHLHGEGTEARIAAWLAAPLLTALVVAACLLLHRGLNRGWGRWLFALPAPAFRRALQTAIERRPS